MHKKLMLNIIPLVSILLLGSATLADEPPSPQCILTVDTPAVTLTQQELAQLITSSEDACSTAKVRWLYYAKMGDQVRAVEACAESNRLQGRADAFRELLMRIYPADTSTSLKPPRKPLVASPKRVKVADTQGNYSPEN